MLGDLYLNGEEVDTNYYLAFRYYIMSSERGNSVSENKVGQCYLKGLGVQQNLQLAFVHFL